MITLKRGYKKYYPINLQKILMTDQQPSGSSDQTEARKNLPRAAKEKVNYKETRTYNKKNSDEGVDISKRSTVTSRTPPPKQREESRQGEESDPEAENTDVTLSNIDNEKHSTPKQTSRDIENSDEDSDNVDDLLSTRVDKDHTLHLKTPIKAEIAPQIQHQPESVYSEEEGVQNESLKIVPADNRSNSEFEEFSAHRTYFFREPSTLAASHASDIIIEEASGDLEASIQFQLALYEAGNNIPVGEDVNHGSGAQPNFAIFDQQIIRIPLIMADMWLKMAKQAPEISSRDSSDSIYEAVDKLRQIGKLVPENQWNSFLKQISAKFDSEIRKYVTKESAQLTNSDKLCDFLEEKFVSKGSYLKNFEELQTIKKRKGENFKDFGKRILKMKELIDKQYLFRHRDQEDITRSQDLEVIALNSFLRYVRTCPALLIAIGNPRNIQEAVDAVEKHEPDLDIADLEEEKKPIISQANTYRRRMVSCQKCSNDGHEAFYCPASACIYCKSTMHKSAECTHVPGDVKIKVICKECKLPGHTIDVCPQRGDRDPYCQFCQAANIHIANSCDIVANLSVLDEVEGAMNNMSINRGHENGMTMARWGSRLPMQGAQSRWTPQLTQHTPPGGPYNPTCYSCGNQGHLARNCPQGQNRPQGGFNRGRGGFSRGRGYSGQQNSGYNNNQAPGYNNNQTPNYGNNQGYNNRSFHRGGGRGGRGNYRGRGNYQPQIPRGFDNRGFPYGSPLTNPFLYPPFMNAGPGLPNWFFANPQAQAMPPQNQNPNTMQGSTPTITMVDSKSEN